MIALASIVARLRADNRGSMLIETAVVAPVLLVMCVGGVEVGTMVEKQNRLQAVAEQATEIVMITEADTPEERSDIAEELEEALPSTGTVEIAPKYRCGTATTLTDLPGTCDEELLSSYIEITMTDTYAPTWTEFGIGNPFTYNVVRTVQVS